MEKWTVRNIRFDIDRFAAALGISKVVAKLLVNRNKHDVEQCKKFLTATTDDFYASSLMLGLDKGVEIMKASIANNEKILIVGDYDVDGVISSYVLYKGLKRCGAEVSYFIPDRIIDGYGINENIITKAKEDNVDLIITCDNGIAAIPQVQLAKDLGMKVIITDHHDVQFVEKENGEREYVIPAADAVINPKQEECKYPFEKLCGAGVAFKFIGRLYEEFNIDKSETMDLIQYVAIATVCDVVDLDSENRIIVKRGLEQINKTNNIGLRALLKETNLEEKEITVYSLGFVIGPCINASGRLEQATWALKLLLTEDANEAKELAQKLNELNKERQDLTKQGLERAISIIETNKMNEEKVLVVYLDDIHESIAGIIAGRIREKYNLPSIVLTRAHEGAKGSGRSIEQYNMFEELLKCKDLLTKFGGHPMAAGLSLPIESIDEFREKLNRETELTDDDIIPVVNMDMVLPLTEISYELIDEIALLEPYGKGNSKPSFGIKGLKVIEGKILGKDRNVLKLRLTDGRIYIDGLYFADIEGFEEYIKVKFGEDEYNKMFNGRQCNVKLDFVYNLDINEFRGKKTVQMMIQNYR